MISGKGVNPMTASTRSACHEANAVFVEPTAT
jgi:hypothetical protein